MKWLKRIGLTIVALLALLVLFLVIINEKRPVGEPGPAADAMAKQLQDAVGNDRWSEIGAVYFDYGGRHQILWDRTRGFAKVDFNGKSALYRPADGTGRALKGGVEVTEPKERDAILVEGHKWFINDTFWMNPFMSLFDQNVTRAIVTEKDGSKGLLITYGSGGVTPGDSYLWFTGADGMPAKWKMWVSVLPVGGIATTWENWQALPGGAKVSTRHHMLITFEMTDLKAGKTLAEIAPGADPFAMLMQ